MENPKGLPAQLVRAFSQHPLGLCGRREGAPVVRRVEGLEKRLNILALGVVLDINPLSEERWSGLVEIEGHWLLDPTQVAYRPSQQVQEAMMEGQILAPRHLPRVWWQICRGAQGRFRGSWSGLFGVNRNDALAVQKYLQQNKTTFPVLAGPVISARWLDLVHRIGGVELSEWGNLVVPLPASLKKAAAQVKIEANKVHPRLFSALRAWSAACRRLPESSCGWGNCPAK